MTFELKNSFTKQSVDDAVKQYQNDRDPRELLFQFKRCMVHFALDDARVKFCTKLKGKGSWFLPFDQGCNDGAGNPVNPHGLKTAYLWEDILQKTSLADIIENYAQVAFRRKLYHSLEELQPDLDAWIAEYNTERTHQGKMCCGRTPMQTLLDGKAIWKEKVGQLN